MKDYLNWKADYLFKRPTRLRNREVILHDNSPKGLNSRLWKKFTYDEDYYISSGGLKYTSFQQLPWSRPLKS